MLQTRCYNKLFKVHIKILVLEYVFDKDLDDLFGPTNLVIIFWQIAVFQYKFYSPQVKRGKISSALVTDFLYEFPRNLLQNLRLRKLGNTKKISRLSGSTAYLPVSPP